MLAALPCGSQTTHLQTHQHRMCAATKIRTAAATTNHAYGFLNVHCTQYTPLQGMHQVVVIDAPRPTSGMLSAVQLSALGMLLHTMPLWRGRGACCCARPPGICSVRPPQARTTITNSTRRTAAPPQLQTALLEAHTRQSPLAPSHKGLCRTSPTQQDMNCNTAFNRPGHHAEMQFGATQLHRWQQHHASQAPVAGCQHGSCGHIHKQCYRCPALTAAQQWSKAVKPSCHHLTLYHDTQPAL